MNRYLFIFVPIIFFLSHHFLIGQNVERNDGYVKILYPNGKVSSEGMIKSGSPDGFWITYYPTGTKKSEGNRKGHLLDSIWNFYTESGDTFQKVNYLMGKKNGYLLTYNVQNVNDPLNKGKLLSKELYVTDQKEGLSVYYFNDGKVKEEIQYSENKRNGISKEYNENGYLITIDNYSNGILKERERINRKDINGLKQGIWKTFYENGRLKSEIGYRDDQLNGLYKEYNEDGSVKIMLKYDQGNLVESSDSIAMEIEVRNEYDSDGKVIYSGSYRKNIPVGVHRQFDKDGKVVIAYLYNNDGKKYGEGILTAEGKKEGPWKYFYDEGNIKSAGSYLNNMEQGTWTFNYKSGRIEQSGIYKNGKAEGLWKWFYEDGTVKREEEYLNGKEEGIYTEYDTTGNILVNGSYFDGQKEGEWFYKVGDYSEKGNFVGDLKDGKWQAYYNDGKLKYEGFYLQGNPDGEHIFYYNNGTVKEINYYVMGICERNWKKFDINGNLILTITYKDNQEYRINGEKIEFSSNDVKLIQ